MASNSGGRRSRRLRSPEGSLAGNLFTACAHRRCDARANPAQCIAEAPLGTALLLFCHAPRPVEAPTERSSTQSCLVRCASLLWDREEPVAAHFRLAVARAPQPPGRPGEQPL